MNKIHSYSKPYNLGREELENFWEGSIVVQEKIDGSQISFGVSKETGIIHIRSRKQPIVVSRDAGGMFQLGINTIMDIAPSLVPGWIYRGEYLQKPKHNLLRYDRVPKGNIILFDVEYEDGAFARTQSLLDIGDDLGLEVVPYLGTLRGQPSIEMIDMYLENDSILGVVLIEGIVMKNYKLRDQDGKVVMAKYVSPEFKERMKEKKPKPGNTESSIVASLIDEFGTEARWRKAILHLREQGVLDNKMSDMPALMKEVGQDTHEEFAEEIRDRLFKFFWPRVSKGLTRGLAEFYKKTLMEDAMGQLTTDAQKNNMGYDKNE